MLCNFFFTVGASDIHFWQYSSLTNEAAPKCMPLMPGVQVCGRGCQKIGIYDSLSEFI